MPPGILGQRNLIVLIALMLAPGCKAQEEAPLKPTSEPEPALRIAVDDIATGADADAAHALLSSAGLIAVSRHGRVRGYRADFGGDAVPAAWASLGVEAGDVVIRSDETPTVDPQSLADWLVGAVRGTRDLWVERAGAPVKVRETRIP